MVLTPLYGLYQKACRHLHRPIYNSIMPEMLEMLYQALETGLSIISIVTKLSNYHLLIIDEWLLDIPSGQEDKYLLEIYERRYDLNGLRAFVRSTKPESGIPLGGGELLTPS